MKGVVLSIQSRPNLTLWEKWSFPELLTDCWFQQQRTRAWMSQGLRFESQGWELGFVFIHKTYNLNHIPQPHRASVFSSTKWEQQHHALKAREDTDRQITWQASPWFSVYSLPFLETSILLPHTCSRDNEVWVLHICIALYNFQNARVSSQTITISGTGLCPPHWTGGETKIPREVRSPDSPPRSTLAPPTPQCGLWGAQLTDEAMEPRAGLGRPACLRGHPRSSPKSMLRHLGPCGRPSFCSTLGP